MAIKGYKATEQDGTCRSKLYEVGKTYSEPDASLCNYGIHYCEKLQDVYRYYPLGSRVFEVLDEGNTDRGDDKNATTKLTFIRELDEDERRANNGAGNTGYCNTGDDNKGNCNTGNCNTGNGNTGDGNIGDYSTGYYCTNGVTLLLNIAVEGRRLHRHMAATRQAIDEAEASKTYTQYAASARELRQIFGGDLLKWYKNLKQYCEMEAE